MRAHSPNDGARCRVRKCSGVDHVGAVNRDAQLAELALLSMDLERGIGCKLCRHPGGNEDFAGSDRAVMNVDATH